MIAVEDISQMALQRANAAEDAAVKGVAWAEVDPQPPMRERILHHRRQRGSMAECFLACLEAIMQPAVIAEAPMLYFPAL